MLTRLSLVILAISMLCFAHGAIAQNDLYYHVPLRELTIISGEVPAFYWGGEDSAPWPTGRSASDFMLPHAAGDAGEEIYLDYRGRYIQAEGDGSYLAIRTSSQKPPSGQVFLPKRDWSEMVCVRFSVAKPADADQTAARKAFLSAKRRHYEYLVRLGVPGAAWFRHQQLEAAEQPTAVGEVPQAAPPRPSDLQETFSLFTGGRAISENLQLDRELRVLSPKNESVDLNTLPGITIKEIDWKGLVQGLNPQRDTLAGSIPYDQHGLFFPSFQAMVDLTDEAKKKGIPVLRLMEPRSEDGRTQERYERQLCLSTDALSRLFGPALISSLAVTGSDPYLRIGSDVAVLFHAVDVAALQAAIGVRHAGAASANAGAKPVSGTVLDTPYTGLLSPDRAVCSYVAAIGPVVVVTNSLVQLERILRTAKGEIPSIGSLDEYTFFRDRYKLGDGDESALLVMTDAAIRRWCGPRWRIADSRRTRTAAAMAELQARHLDALAAGQVTPGAVKPKERIPGIGDLSITAGGIASSLYGTLDFMTPIVEIPMEKVTPEEGAAYERFRQGYQSNWSRYFDPIALRFVVRPERIAVDVTARPLILASEYQEFARITQGAVLTAGAGDPHDGTIFHYVFSLDPGGQAVRSYGNLLPSMVPGIVSYNPLEAIGKWITLFVEDDPVWQELEKLLLSNARGWESQHDFLKKNWQRLPVAVEIAVADPLKITAVLAGLRAFIDQTAPGMLQWETVTYKEHSYVKVAATATGSEMAGIPSSSALYYVPTPQVLILSPNAPLLERAIDRIVVQKTAAESGKEVKPANNPWLGENMSASANKAAFAILQAFFNSDLDTTLERRAWGNIPILNEWRQRYPQTSPVDFHQRFWQTRLVCPGGGEYVWNDELQTMESTVYGCPAKPRTGGRRVLNLFSEVVRADLGLTFENDGLRAHAVLTRASK